MICGLLFGRRRHEAAKFVTGLSDRMMDEDPVKRPTLESTLREVEEYMTKVSSVIYSGTD